MYIKDPEETDVYSVILMRLKKPKEAEQQEYGVVMSINRTQAKKNHTRARLTTPEVDSALAHTDSPHQKCPPRSASSVCLHRLDHLDRCDSLMNYAEHSVVGAYYSN